MLRISSDGVPCSFERRGQVANVRWAHLAATADDGCPHVHPTQGKGGVALGCQVVARAIVGRIVGVGQRQAGNLLNQHVAQQQENVGFALLCEPKAGILLWARHPDINNAAAWALLISQRKTG
jgi:hypothetical protein